MTGGFRVKIKLFFAYGEGSSCAVAPESSLVAYWVIVSPKAE